MGKVAKKTSKTICKTCPINRNLRESTIRNRKLPNDAASVQIKMQLRSKQNVDQNKKDKLQKGNF